MMPDETQRRAAAFGAGSDARLAGQSPRINPYLPSSTRGQAWLAGWWCVQEHYGVDARWPVKPLPPVREVA